jgi:hypothetical protein
LARRRQAERERGHGGRRVRARTAKCTFVCKKIGESGDTYSYLRRIRHIAVPAHGTHSEYIKFNNLFVSSEYLSFTRLRTERREPLRIRLCRIARCARRGGGPGTKDQRKEYLVMARTLIGLFNDKNDAQRALLELTSAGFPREDIDVIARNGVPAADGDVTGNLTRLGVPAADAQDYSNRVADGKAVVVVQASDAAAQRAITVMERNGANDVDQESGASASGIAAAPGAVAAVTAPMEAAVGTDRLTASANRVAGAGISMAEGGAAIPRDENELSLAREDVANAANIEARKAEDRNPSQFKPAANPFRDSSGGDAGANPDREYAHTYGETLASDPRHQGKDWEAIEPDARNEWATQNKGMWEEFKDMVRHAWEKMAGN